MKKTLFLLLFVVAGWQSALAQTFTYAGIKYNVTSASTVEVADQNQLAIGTVAIPAQVTANSVTYTVNRICDNAFEYCTALTAVTIPNTVTSFGSNVFRECSGLVLVTMSNSLQTFSEGAFAGCSSLTSITIPNSVTKIGWAAFYGCSNLTSITIPNSVAIIDGGAFQSCSGLTTITIPNSVTTFGGYVFSDCVNLRSVTLPNTLTRVEGSIFQNCYRLTNIAMPNSVTSIGGAAFRNCVRLKSVTLPSAITSIEAEAFSGCKALSSLAIPNTVTHLGNGVFKECVSLKSMTIPNLVPTIRYSTFENCSGLTSVILPNSITSIEQHAFRACTGLLSITIPNAVTSIGEGAFSDCQSLTTVAIPNLVTSIGAGAFLNCFSLTSVNIPNNVTYLGNGAFQYCSALTSIDIPNSVLSLESFTFYGCSSLTAVVVHRNQLWVIDSSVFQGVNQPQCVLVAPSGYTWYMDFWNRFRQIWAITTTTKITTNQCGVTLPAFNSNFSADIVPYAQMYCFEVRQGATVRTFETTTNICDMTKFAGITYGTIYAVRVKVKMGVWNDYGTACNITTPAFSPNNIPTTNIQPAFMNATLEAFNTSIPAVAVYSATSYRFQIITAGVTTIYDSPTSSFRLTDAAIAAYETTYAIRVAAKVNGTYGNYGASYNVSTPTIVTKLLPTACGATLATIDTKIGAVPIPTANGYRFEITCDGATTIYNSSVYNLKLSDALVAAYNKTYAIRVAVLIGSNYKSFGATCYVTTPSITDAIDVPVTSLRVSQCGTILATIGSPIHSELVYAAEAYRFQLTNGTTVTEVESPIYYFFLTNTAVGTYGTTFSVKTKAKIAGIWGNYGTACSISTPALTSSSVPTTQLRPSYCNATLAALTTKISASLVYNSEGYRFEITKGATVVAYDAANYFFSLADAGIVATTGTTYTIRVAAKINGVYGNYGASCNVTTPGNASNSRQIVENVDFSLVAYPNPSNSVFKLQINGASDEVVSILVFDMTGRQIENKVVNATDVENIALGQNYSIGVYNVIVSQGMNTKTVRLVKK